MPLQRLRPLTDTLLGGLVFLLPLIVVLAVVGHGLQLALQAVTPLVQQVPQGHVGGIALASIAAVLLLIALCWGAGVLARAAIGRRLSTGFEDKLTAVYPRYHVIKAMSQGLHGAIGQQVLRPVLVTFGEQQQVGYDIERLSDGRAVVFMPGSPDVWAGSVVLVEATRLEPLAIDPAALSRALQGMGRGLATLLAAAAAKRPPAS
jgi:uncharacterized membrane protein